MWSSSDSLHQGPLQTWWRNRSDQDSRQEEPNQDASNSIQEPEQLQLHFINLSYFKLKFLRKTLRHNNPKLRKLSSKHSILCESSTEREHVIQRPDASQGLHQKNSHPEDQRIINILQLPNGNLRVLKFQHRRHELICNTILSIKYITKHYKSDEFSSKFKNIWFLEIMTHEQQQEVFQNDTKYFVEVN